MKPFIPPEYWRRANRLVQTGSFLQPFRNFWFSHNKPEYFEFIRRANHLSTVTHIDDRREGNSEPYVYHAQRPALMAAFRLGIYGPGVTAAFLLHDAPEDHPDTCPIWLIRVLLGDYVAYLADAMNKPDVFDKELLSQLQAKKVAAAGDVAIIIKGYERIDNLFTPPADLMKYARKLDETENNLLEYTKVEPLLYKDLRDAILLGKIWLES